MRKGILLGLYVCASHTLGHSQSNTTQLPNGVIVHQAEGIESTSEPKKIEQVHNRTIEDLNLPECIEALSQVSIKLNEASESDREYYLSEKNKLTKRINELKSTK
jgi:hypothetical protein